MVFHSISIAVPEDAPRVANLLIGQFPERFLNWSRPQVLEMVNYYITSRLCAITVDEEWRVIGVVIGRPVSSAHQGSSDSYAVDWKGLTLWVEYAVVGTKWGFWMLRWSVRYFNTLRKEKFTHIAYFRPKTNKVHSYELNHFNSKFYQDYAPNPA